MGPLWIGGVPEVELKLSASRVRDDDQSVAISLDPDIACCYNRPVGILLEPLAVRSWPVARPRS